MREEGLVRDLLPQLERIAEDRELASVSRVEMIVGLLHGAAAERLVQTFEQAFEGTRLKGAKVAVTVVKPGQPYTAPRAERPCVASGWEIFICRVE